jgi:hypothetical protein
MPLYQEWQPKPHTLAAIWHISEDEDFFSAGTGLASLIKHSRKRLEHLCGRWLLRLLREDFPLHQIAPDEHDKPRLPENRFFFSISHSFPYVAAVISEQEECGIDIQVWKSSIGEVAYMFLSEKEMALCRLAVFEPGEAAAGAPDARLLTLAWCAKEAAYKWNGRRGVNFIADLPIRCILGVNWDSIPGLLPQRFQVEMQAGEYAVSMPAWLHGDFACALLLQHRSG